MGSFVMGHGLLLLDRGSAPVLALEPVHVPRSRPWSRWRYSLQQFGYAVAMAWIVGALLVGFTLFQLRILSRVQFKTAEA